MKNLLTLLVTVVFIGGLTAQNKNPLLIESEKGDIQIIPILHSTMAIYFDGKVIYTDPYGGKEAFNDIKPADLILITDIHGDHMNKETLTALGVLNTPIVAPKAVAEQIGDEFKGISVLGNGESTQRAGVLIEAVPMYNLPESPDSRHTKGRGNGYILTLGGKKIYISGDTEDITEIY